MQFLKVGQRFLLGMGLAFLGSASVFADDNMGAGGDAGFQEAQGAVNAVVVASQECECQLILATNLFADALDIRAQFLQMQGPETEIVLPLVNFWLEDANQNIFGAIRACNSAIDEGIIASSLFVLGGSENYSLIISYARSACREFAQATAMAKTAQNELNLAIEAMQGGGSAPPQIVPGF